MPSPFTIAQQSGSFRAIQLRGRALPFRGGSWESEMRVDDTWYPGNPVANSQVIGFREMPSIFNGRWSDKTLFDSSDINGVRLLNFPPVTGAGLPTAAINAGSTFAAPNAFPVGTQKAQLAQTVRDAFDLLLREGQKLRVTFGPRVRFGYLVRFKDTPWRGNDIEWEMEFKWTGRVGEFPARTAPKVNLLSTKAGLQKLLDALLAALGNIGAFLNQFQARVATLVNTIATVLAAIGSIASLRFAPTQVISTIKSALQLIKSLVASLVADLRRSAGASQQAAAVGLPDAVAIAKLAQSAFRKRIQEIAAFATEQQRLLDTLATTEVLATIVVQEQTTLRDVSTRFYGTPNNWRKIASFNQFAGSTVPAGTTVLVPKLA